MAVGTREERRRAPLSKNKRARAMRGCFELCLLLIFHFFSFFFVYVFYCGRQPSRSVHWHSSARSTVITRPSRSSKRRRDPNKTLLSGVQRQQYSRAAHRPPNSASFRRKRPAARPKRRPWLGNRPSPTAASVGCLLYTSPSPRDLSTSRMPSSA